MFKKLIAFTLIACFLGFNNMSFGKDILVPSNISIYVSPTNTTSSKILSTDNINAQIVDDVIIDNTLIFRAGDKAICT